jgi:hypothetical protein
VKRKAALTKLIDMASSAQTEQRVNQERIRCSSMAIELPSLKKQDEFEKDPHRSNNKMVAHYLDSRSFLRYLDTQVHVGTESYPSHITLLCIIDPGHPGKAGLRLSPNTH